MGEGYRNIKPSALPLGVQFGEPRSPVGQLQASFSDDKGDWGAAYRKLVHMRTKAVQFSRYYNTPDATPGEEE